MSAAVRRRLRSWAAGRFLGLLTRVLGRLSWRTSQRLGRSLGHVGWWLAGRDRERALSHLAIAFPDASLEERRRLARACFRHLGTSLGECLHLAARPEAEAQRHIDVEGFDAHVKARLEAGEAFVMVTGHCGNWELLASLRRSHGLPVWALQRGLDDPILGAAILALREHLGATNLPRGDRASSRAMLRALRQGGAIVVLLDQDIDTESVWVPFFDRLAHTPLAATRLARRRGLPVIPAFAERRDDGRHTLRFGSPLPLPDDDIEATAVMTRAIETQIRRCPEQWVWMHRRWRRRPPGEA